MYYSEKHGYLDQDILFSVAFVHLLMEAARPKQSIRINGFAEARSLLRYLASIGNQGAVSRLTEADQIAHHLSLFSLSSKCTRQPSVLRYTNSHVTRY